MRQPIEACTRLQERITRPHQVSPLFTAASEVEMMEKKHRMKTYEQSVQHNKKASTQVVEHHPARLTFAVVDVDNLTQERGVEIVLAAIRACETISLKSASPDR